MKIKRILAAALVLSTLTFAAASAEHPSAEQYREMLRSDNFYLEYEFSKGKEKKGAYTSLPFQSREILSSEAGRRMASFVSFEQKGNKLPGIFGLFGLGGDVEMKRGAQTPKALFMNGNYYIFQPQGGKPYVNTVFTFADMGQLIKQGMNKNLNLEARVCPSNQLNIPDLDLTEGWGEVQSALELPDALTVFNDDDSYQKEKGRMKLNVVLGGEIYFDNSYRDYNMPPRTSPAFVESRRVTLDKKEYDCDRYVAEIKTMGGATAAQILYDVFYDENGKLMQIDRNFSRNGKTESLGSTVIWELTSQLPDKAFFISDKPIKVYAAGMGDANDFLEIDVQVGTIGGASEDEK